MSVIRSAGLRGFREVVTELGGDPLDLARRAREAANAVTDLAATVHSSFGDQTVEEYLWQLIVARTLGAEALARTVGLASPVDDELAAAGVQPWSGPRSLPLWLPRPAYDGMLAHDWTPSEAAGLTARPLAETARDTLAWLRATPDAVVTGLTREEEAEVLASLS